jgi:hypothetical protein
MLRAEQVDAFHFFVRCGNGRIEIGDYHDEAQGDAIRSVLAEAKRQGNGWHYDSTPLPPGFTVRSVGHSVGPVRWDFFTNKMRGHSIVVRQVWFPFWLLSLTTAAWPLASIGLLIRRRLRLTGVGCCVNCGYDLRATPEVGGELLAQCPECGRPTTANV